MTDNHLFLDGKTNNKKINSILNCFIMRKLNKIAFNDIQLFKDSVIEKSQQKNIIAGYGI